ncbi:hypothetical protein D3C71_640970 [compost metagenome]
MIVFLILFQSLFASAQLKCKTTNQPEGSTIKQCFHQNGKISTLESWDKDKRFGTIKGYNNQGKELFSHDLRSIGGHASVSMTYFPNGQLEKVYFSDAPDGGIQFYNSTTRFDEKGNQTEFTETKYPQQLELERLIPDTVKRRKPLVEINQVLDQKKTKKQIQLLIENKTKRKVEVSIQLNCSDKPYTETKTLTKKASCFLESNFLLDSDTDFSTCISIELKSDRFELIRGQDVIEKELICMTWYIIGI